jgi:repressor LexA
MITEYKNKIDSIIGFYRNHKRMPSYAEIMALVGFKSKNAVYKLVNKLTAEGIIGKDSSGRLIPKSFSGIGGFGMGNEVPLLGLVEAGIPSVAEEMAFDTLNIDEYLIGGKGVGSTYLLEVKGDSMIDEGIHEGDLVVAQRTEGGGGDDRSGNGVAGKAALEPKDGDIVIANIDGGWTMKYFRKRRDYGGRNDRAGRETIYLEAANKKYKPIYPQESLKIAAIVKGVIRKY